jgi:hypothetical protein
MIVTDYRLNANHNGANNGITQQQIVTDYRLNANRYNSRVAIASLREVVICI